MTLSQRSRSAFLAVVTVTAVLAATALGNFPVAAASPAGAAAAAANGGTVAQVEATATVAGAAVVSGVGGVHAATTPAGAAPRVVLGSPILTGYSLPVLFVPRGPTHSTGYVVEQRGTIQRVSYNATTHTWKRSGVFLDIRSLVTDPTGPGATEQGLLGLAFAPGFDTNGHFYVYYTARSDGQDTLSEFTLKSGKKVNPNTERRILHYPDPYPNHNGGNLLFEGHDLYIGIGDGGSGGDPGNRAQNLHTQLGKILRIDPRDPDGKGPKRYSVPADNPFVGVHGAKAEIWAYGLRNPWRWSIDPPTGDLWIGDVGQCQYEEVDHDGDARGDNFGWRVYEGTHVYNTSDCTASEPVCSSNCDTLPVAEYDHSDGSCAITGGWVYRGSAYPAWQGRYLYGDYCSGKMWTISATGSPGTPEDVTPTDGTINISSFARDDAGELYAVSLGGSIYALHLTGTP